MSLLPPKLEIVNYSDVVTQSREIASPSSYELRVELESNQMPVDTRDPLLINPNRLEEGKHSNGVL